MPCRNVFLLVASLLALFYWANFGWVTRLPLGHDTLQYLQLQYTFLNEAVTKHEFAYWFPFMTMGTVSNWWFMISDGLLNNLYLLVSPLLAGGNYYAPFYLSLFFDELVLLAGAVCLARRLYTHGLTMLFIALSIVFSVNWATQIWFGFHVFYLAPLTMFLFMDAWRNSRPLSAVAGCMCIVYAFYGNLFYTIPLLFWMIALPAGIRAIFCLKPSFLRTGERRGITWSGDPVANAWRRIVTLTKGRQLIAYCVPLACVVLIGFYLKQLGIRDIIAPDSSRNADGTVSLANFLSYGGSVGYRNIFEFVTGITFSVDHTLYLGGIAAVFALFEAWCVISERRFSSASAIFLISSVVVYLFSSGNTVVGSVFYYLPGMSFFRHIESSAVFAKLYLILAAGFGFDRLLSAGADLTIRHRLTWAAITVIIIKIVFWGLVMLDLAAGWNLLKYIAGSSYNDVSRSVRLMWLIPFLAASIVITLLLLLRLRTTAARGNGTMIGLIALQALDLVAFRVSNLNSLMPANDASAQHLKSRLAYEDYQYPPRRVLDARFAPRFEALGAVQWEPIGGLLYAFLNNYGIICWNTETFLLTDAARSLFRIDHRLKSLHRLASLRNHYIAGPLERFARDPIYEKMIGIRNDKIQFFRTIRMAESEFDADYLLGNPQFCGDILVGWDKRKTNASTLATARRPKPNENDRVYAPHTIDRFSFSSLDLTVQNPHGSPIALYYADTFHPYWRASVNGRQTPIISANHAFKAIIVPPGLSRVSFVYAPLKLRIAVLALVTIGLSGVALMAYLVTLLLRGNIDRLLQNDDA